MKLKPTRKAEQNGFGTGEQNADRTRTGIQADEPKGKESSELRQRWSELEKGEGGTSMPREAEGFSTKLGGERRRE